MSKVRVITIEELPKRIETFFVKHTKNKSKKNKF